MNRNITFKVINARKVSFALLSASIAVGFTDEKGKFVGLFEIPDFLLKKSETKGYYYQGPSKPLIKDGVHQVDAKTGYKKYIEFFRLFTEPNGSGETKPSKESFEARKEIINLLVQSYEAIGGGSAAPAASREKPGRAPARAAKPAEASSQIDEDELGSPADSGDDDLPF